MTASERQVAELFAWIQHDDPGGTNEQFNCLASANQYRLLYTLTEQHVAGGARVLDWGCGRGHFSYFLVKRGFEVTAYSLEPEPEIFAALSEPERGRLTFVRGAPEEAWRLPFGDGQFAAAFSVGVLEHVQEVGGDELSSLRELRRVLAHDGSLVCYHLPNRYSYIEAASRRFGLRKVRGDFHQYRFTGRDIRELCRKADLSLVDSGRYGFLPRNSLGRLPSRLRNAQWLTSALNRSDEVLELLFAPLVQNHYFVARLNWRAEGEIRPAGDPAASS